MIFKRLTLALVLVWPATSQAQVPASVVTAQCALFEKAYVTTQNADIAPFQDILVGCPGYENFREQMKRRESARAFRKAMSTKRPPEVKALGEAGKRVFQLMIARGVPPAVATALAGTSTFKKAATETAKIIK